MFIVLEKVNIDDNSIVPSWYVPDELMAHSKIKKKKKNERHITDWFDFFRS